MGSPHYGSILTGSLFIVNRGPQLSGRSVPDQHGDCPPHYPSTGLQKEEPLCTVGAATGASVLLLL